MLYNKISRIMWTILFFISIIGIIKTTNDMIYFWVFCVSSSCIFIIDYISVRKRYNRDMSAKRKWHIFANFSQWLFWVAVLYLPFISEQSFGYKSFVLADLFLVTAFTMYMYKK